MNKIFVLDIGATLINTLFDGIIDLLYQKIVDLLGEFFAYMNTMGSDLFGMPWINQIVRLFGMLGWALFVVGIIVALFDFAIESQNGRGDPKALALNIIKGFMAASLFTVVPVKLCGCNAKQYVKRYDRFCKSAGANAFGRLPRSNHR